MTEPTQPSIDENAALTEIAKALEADGIAQSMAAQAETTGSPFPPGVKMDPAVTVKHNQGGLCYACGGGKCIETAIETAPTMNYPQWAAQAGIPIPIDDLRERIAVLEKAWVQRYRDGAIEIVFDTDARKSATTLPPGFTRERI